MNALIGEPVLPNTAVSAAVQAFADGRAVIILDDSRELEADFAVRASACTPEIVNLFLSRGRGILCLTLSDRRARTIGIGRQISNGKDPFATPFGLPVSLDDGTTSISTRARSRTIQGVAAMTEVASNLIIPGHVQTLIAHPDLTSGRLGHTETVLELARLAGAEDVAVLCEILNDSGEVADLQDLNALAAELDIPIVTLDTLINAARACVDVAPAAAPAVPVFLHRAWRNRGQAAVSVTRRAGANWLLNTGGMLIDCSGGTLVKTLGDVPAAPASLADISAPLYGFDLPWQAEAEAALGHAAGDGLAGTLWTSSGTDAMEAAIRAAQWAIKLRGEPFRGFVSLRGSYHGASVLCSALSSRTGLPEGASPWPVHFLQTQNGDSVEDVLDRLDRQMGGQGGSGRIFCLEAMATAGWTFGWDGGFVRALIAGLQTRGYLVIQDEIASGAYRHGTFISTGFAFTADAVVVSKGLTQGRGPLAAVLLGAELDAALAATGAQLPGHTFGLTAQSAWYAAQAIRSLSDLLNDRWFDVRAKMLAESRAQLADTALHLDVSRTTLRVACPADRLAPVRAALQDRGLWCYTTTSRYDARQFGFIHVCPLFDLPTDVQADQFVAVAKAVKAGLAG